MEKTKTLAYELQRGRRIFCAGMTCQKNIGRDIVIIGLAITIAGMLLRLDHGKKEKKEIIRESSGRVAGVFFEEGGGMFLVARHLKNRYLLNYLYQPKRIATRQILAKVKNQRPKKCCQKQSLQKQRFQR
jgi:hypothetical protein